MTIKDTRMSAEQREIARAQLNSLGGLMQHLYVKREFCLSGPAYTASYVVKRRDTGEIVFYRTAHLVGEYHIAGGHALHKMPCALQALEQHFNPAFIARDGMQEMYTLACEHGRYKPDSLEHNIVYGQEVYSADLEQLDLPGDTWIVLS